MPNAAVDLPLPSPVFTTHDRARRARAFGEMVLFGWFDRRHVRLGRTFLVVKVACCRACGGDRTHRALAAGCAASGYDAGALQGRLVSAGV